MTRDHDRHTDPDLPEQVRSLLSEEDTWADPPPELQEEIRQALRRERNETPASEAAPPDAIPFARRDHHDRAPARPAISRRLWLGVAAAALAIVAVGVGVTLSRNSPPDATADLTATALAPEAFGRAEFRDTPSGFKIELDTTGLPPAAPGTFYQAWLKNAAGQLVTIGTFHARVGGENIILWSAVDPGDYPTITVTVQQEGAGAQSSGRVVLTGTIRP